MATLTKDQKIAMLVLPVVLFGVLGISYASADFGDLTDEQKSAIEQAHNLRESGDFDGAKEVLQSAGLPGKGLGPWRLQNLTDDQKTALQKAHELRQSGDEAGAQKVLEDAGVPFPPHGMRERGGPNSEKRAAIETAIKNNDYDAFVEATKDAPFANMVNEDLFNTMVKAHELNQAGDHEGARTLMENAGFPFLDGHGHRSPQENGTGGSS